MKWYVVNVYSGFEQRVSDAIHDAAQKAGLTAMFGEVLVPKENVVELKKGEKVQTERKFFPGYILVQMTLTDETWHLVRGISKVSGFLGSKSKPIPLSSAEVQRVRQRVVDSANNVQNSVTYEVGDSVMVCDGPFSSFQGIIEEVETEKERVKVSVSIFGRSTNVDLSFAQIEKIH